MQKESTGALHHGLSPVAPIMALQGGGHWGMGQGAPTLRGTHHSALLAQASIQVMSERKWGAQLPQHHKDAIAAAQRRRHAACRVLAAVEEVWGS